MNNPKFRIQATKFSGPPGTLCPAPPTVSNTITFPHPPHLNPHVSISFRCPPHPLDPHTIGETGFFLLAGHWWPDNRLFIRMHTHTHTRARAHTHRHTHEGLSSMNTVVLKSLNRFVKIYIFMYIIALLSSKNSQKISDFCDIQGRIFSVFMFSELY